MKLFCGIDWAEAHHDVAIVDSDGQLVAKKRITDDPSGFAELIEALTAAGESVDEPIPVAIETPRGLLVSSLRATGRPVYSINPLAVARYRERHSVARAKSDHADAMTLANILRVDAHLHRRLPADTELCQAIAALARAHQDAIWRRTKAHNELRSVLREFFPTFLATFAGRFPLGIASPAARAILAIGPTPAAAAKLSVTRIAAALRRAGRSRNIDQTAAVIKSDLRIPQLRQPVLVENAMGVQVLALLAALDTACSSVEDLGRAAAESFQKHPDYAIITSFPGLADSTGARVLAEIGDDRARFVDARALKATPDPRQSPEPRAAPSPSPTAGSRTIGWPPPDGSGPSAPPPIASPRASTTAGDGNTETVTPPRSGTCSTGSSVSSTTACNTGNRSRSARLSHRPSLPPPNGKAGYS
jgi:transposase